MHALRTLIVTAVVFASPAARAERPPTSATAAFDRLIEDLLAKRFAEVARGLAPKVTLTRLVFTGACKKSFGGKRTAVRSEQLAKCLAADVSWPRHRVTATEKPIKDGWRVTFDDVQALVRQRKGGGYEIYELGAPSRSDELGR